MNMKFSISTFVEIISATNENPIVVEYSRHKNGCMLLNSVVLFITWVRVCGGVAVPSGPISVGQILN